MKNILLSFLTLTIVSCSDTDDSIGLFFNQESYNTNRELWENSEIFNYTFSQEFFSTATGPQPKLSTVIKNETLDTIYVVSNEYSDSVKYLIHLETINDVFNYINNTVESCKEQINSSKEAMEGAKIEVDYNENYYYPTKIICTGYYPDGYVGGLGTEIIITDFKEN